MFKKWIRRWLQDDYQIQPIRASDAPSTRPTREGMSFMLYPAVGGHVLETRCYDSKTDRNIGTLYMIDGEGDFAEQVSKAIMMEMMKQ